MDEVATLLNRTNALNMIENFQTHPDQTVYLLSRDIIEKYVFVFLRLFLVFVHGIQQKLLNV